MNGDPPTFYSEVERHARATHICCECKRRILPGEAYSHCTGIWDGRWRRFKVCSVCRDLALRIEEDSYQHDELPAFGELYGYAEDCDYLCVVRASR